MHRAHGIPVGLHCVGFGCKFDRYGTGLGGHANSDASQRFRYHRDAINWLCPIAVLIGEATMYRVLIAFAVMFIVEPVYAFEIGTTQTNCSGPQLTFTGPCSPLTTLLGIPVHQNITKDALSKITYLQSATAPFVSFTSSAITEIQDGNAWVDGYQHLPAFHFDNAGLSAGSNRLMTGETLLIESIGPITTN